MSSDTRITLTYDLINCTTQNIYKYLDINNVVITITANENFYFIEDNTENYLLYENGNKIYPAKYETVDNVIKNVKMIIKMLDYPTNATIHCIAHNKETLINKIKLIQNIVNCTTNFIETEINPNETINITITAFQDYEFSYLSPTYKINNSATQIFTRINDTTYTAEIIAPTEGTIIVKANAEKIVYIPVTQNLISCNTNFNKDKMTPKESATVRLTPNDEYYFSYIPTYNINGIIEEFSRLYDSKIFQALITAPTKGEIIINATAEIIKYSISYQLNYCTSNYNENTFTKGIIITITANEGYVFDNKNSPYITNGYTTDKSACLNKISNYEYQLDTSKINSDILKYSITIVADCIKEISPLPPAPSKSYGFCDIYLPKIENLFELSGDRFYNSDMQKIDIFQYIFKCHKLFFNVNAEFYTQISLANYRTNIYCNGTTQTFLNVNCGNVFIEEKYNNVFDYQFTKSVIYLPFIGFKEIDTSNIMNSNITLEYKANIIDGTTLAVISSDTRGELYQFEGVASYDIPYMINQYKNSINHELYHNSAYLGNFTPSIQLFTNKPYGVDNNNVFGYGVNQWCKIGDCKGYIKCADIQLILSKNFITNSEMEMITTLLKNGVFI